MFHRTLFSMYLCAPKAFAVKVYLRLWFPISPALLHGSYMRHRLAPSSHAWTACPERGFLAAPLVPSFLPHPCSQKSVLANRVKLKQWMYEQSWALHASPVYIEQERSVAKLPRCRGCAQGASLSKTCFSLS